MKALLFCLISIFAMLPVGANASERENALQTSRQLFGEPIDAERNLYEVNRFYVYRIAFDERDRVGELAVEPKYYFAEFHPEWEKDADYEPLSFAEYKSLLERLESVKSKGNLTNKAKIGITGNATAFYNDRYENALLETGYFFVLKMDENAPQVIRFFRLKFGAEKRKETNL